jgi:hypothetical protein
LPADRRVLTRAALIVAMAVGSVFMWLGVPFGLIYLVSKMVNTTQPTLGPYLIVLFGIPAGMAIIGKGLAGLDRAYGRVTGEAHIRRRPSWMKSMRGERDEPGDHRWRVLDMVMIWSVSLAGLCMAVWFFGFAGSSLPGS